MTAEQFEKLVHEGYDAIPRHLTDRLDNVAIVIEDEPSPRQLGSAHLHPGWTLFGLYEGVPQTGRANYTGVLPDKITIFRRPIEAAARSAEEVREIVRNTFWHEIAHHFGFDERQVRRLEAERRGRK